MGFEVGGLRLLGYRPLPPCQGHPLVLQVVSIKDSSMGALSLSDFSPYAIGYPVVGRSMPFGLGIHLPRGLLYPVGVALALWSPN